MQSMLLLWNCTSALCANTGYHDTNSESGIFKDVQTIECQLNEWNRLYRAELTKDIQITNSLYNRMTIDILNIVNEWVLLIVQYKQRETLIRTCSSLVVSLYSFLLRLLVSQDGSNGVLRSTALRKVNQASVRVSEHVHALLGSVKVEDFPQWL